MKKDPMLDEIFLRDLSLQKNRVLYAKIIALDINENPIEEIQGRITQGSVPVDGDSILRRTCSLTIAAKDLNLTDYIWGLKTKIKLYVGLSNNIDPTYDPITWFKMGTFVLTSFNHSLSASGHTVSIQGKDKMCLLNGDVGGNLTALSYDFGKETVVDDNGISREENIPIERIIREAVHTFANEPYHNIVINDLDEIGLELLEYRGSVPLYFIYDVKKSEISNMTMNQEQEYYANDILISIGEMEQQNNEAAIEGKPLPYVFKILNANMDIVVNEPTKFYIGAQGPYNIIKIEPGMTCGYRTTELVYAGQLVGQAGEPITTMLSKIVSMLGNFEYFYNLDGQFVFQKKRTYINTSWNNIVNNGDETWIENSSFASPYIFSFEDGNLVSSYQNNPNLANLKNDFSIWGQRSGIGGASIPIHYRYAIDHKPIYYTNWEGITYTTRTQEEVEWDKQNIGINISDKGYVKEKARFGLSEDWWEVRDWAKAWQYSGLPVPTKNLGSYCLIKAIVHPTSKPYTMTPNIQNAEDYEVPDAVWDEWQVSNAVSYFRTDDLIFTKDGKYDSYHGTCAHTYTWWLEAMEGQHKDKYVYFYKPQVPAEDIVINNGQGLILGKEIKYKMDWRELIYQMALDYNKHHLDPNFVSTLARNNPNYFPTGYTGYEQYYIDLEGFWRQLYDPEYEKSYKQIALTKTKYDEESKFGEWYYKNPTTKAIEPIPLNIEEFNSKETYYKYNNNIYEAVSITSQQYNLQRKNLYVKRLRKNYYRCRVDKEYHRTKLYYTLQDNQYVPASNITEVDYTNAPWNYYERTIEGGNIIFSCCSSIQHAYKSNETYYQAEYNIDGSFKRYTPVAHFSQETYNDLANNDYYYLVEVGYYEPCVSPAIQYNANYSYYELGPKEYELDTNSPSLYWNKTIQTNPEKLNFWFDFLDTYGELAKLSSSEIGNRPKAVNDNNVKSIYFRETPGVIFVNDLTTLTAQDKKTGYVYCQIPDVLQDLFSISSQGKSAKDVLDGFLSDYTNAANSVSIAAMPVYYLEPNTRVLIHNDESGIDGDYIIKKITFPLDANGTMSITASKIIDKIY